VHELTPYDFKPTRRLRSNKAKVTAKQPSDKIVRRRNNKLPKAVTWRTSYRARPAVGLTGAWKGTPSGVSRIDSQSIRSNKTGGAAVDVKITPDTNCSLLCPVLRSSPLPASTSYLKLRPVSSIWALEMCKIFTSCIDFFKNCKSSANLFFAFRFHVFHAIGLGLALCSA